MERPAKIQLSAYEQDVVADTEWILTKQGIIKKVFQLFGELDQLMKKELITFKHLFSGTECLNGKISRGENYLLLPYVILDYPSFFGRNNIFAVRTMFWWGNFFSITLHVSGEYKARFIDGAVALPLLQQSKFFVCTGADEWQHHFGEDNYQPSGRLTEEEFNRVLDRPFFKAAKKISLTQWDDAPLFIMNGFKEILELLQANFQDDRKGLSPVFPITGSGL